MHPQKVEAPKLTPLRGLLAVAAIVAAVILDWFAAQLVGLFLGQAAVAVVFWTVGLLIALAVMRMFVLSYTYLMSDTLLRISFAYGRYERVMTDIYFNNILFVGDPEDVKKRYPKARINKATLTRAPIPALAVACRDGGKPTIYVLQPDDEIREKLVSLRKKK